MAVQHSDKKALEIWAREIASSGTGMTPGSFSVFVLEIWNTELA